MSEIKPFTIDVPESASVLRIDLDQVTGDLDLVARRGRAVLTLDDAEHVADSLLGPGATVGGRVERCVVGREAIVEPGASVRESVLLPGAVVRSGATVVRAEVDDHVDVRAAVGEPGGEIALVGCGASVEQDVPAGGRYPGTD